MSTYDDWKTTDPNDALYCENGHYMCPHRCPLCKGCVDSCDCEREDEEAEYQPDTQGGEQ